ncbi:MAG: helix-turn-helix transcriptional regulator [Bacillaceae bacterium]|nr:helix-turn-helix transcriptional regulator [Bacillaceae bacterium]
MKHDIPEVKYITSMDQLKVVTRPIRIEILDIFNAKDDALSVQEMAERLDQPPSKLHYHVKELEKHGFLKQVRTRQINGIMQKYFVPTAREFRVAKTLVNLKEDGVEENSSQYMLDTLWDQVRLLTEQGREAEISVHSSILTLSQDQKKQLEDRIKNVTDNYIRELRDKGELQSGSGRDVYLLGILTMPMAEGQEE